MQVRVLLNSGLYNNHVKWVCCLQEPVARSSCRFGNCVYTQFAVSEKIFSNIWLKNQIRHQVLTSFFKLHTKLQSKCLKTFLVWWNFKILTATASLQYFLCKKKTSRCGKGVGEVFLSRMKNDRKGEARRVQYQSRDKEMVVEAKSGKKEIKGKS